MSHQNNPEFLYESSTAQYLVWQVYTVLQMKESTCLKSDGMDVWHIRSYPVTFDVDPLIQWLTETGFLVKTWPMTLSYNSLTSLLSKSDGWLNFKIWRVTFSWILGTHVDPQMSHQELFIWSIHVPAVFTSLNSAVMPPLGSAQRAFSKPSH